MTYCAIKWLHYIRSSPNFVNRQFLLIYTFCEEIKSFEAKLTIFEKGLKWIKIPKSEKKRVFSAHDFWCIALIELKFSGMVGNNSSDLFAKFLVNICDIHWKIAKKRKKSWNLVMWLCDVTWWRHHLWLTSNFQKMFVYLICIICPNFRWFAIKLTLCWRSFYI